MMYPSRWELAQPLWKRLKKINLSRRKTRRGQIGTRGGRPPHDDRVMVTGIWFVLRTGCPWRDMP
ncbi:MAG: transposase, partial [Opitutae bacterium]|nr:transposase [Opitutae bacterium]